MSKTDETIYASRILVVDDDKNNADTLAEMLTLTGFQSVHILHDQRKALVFIQNLQPDLIILDLHMPHINGLELLEIMKRQQLVHDKNAVIMLTGSGDMNAKVKALELGASDFITKPFSFLEVKTRIQNLLNKILLYKKLDNYNQLLEERVRERTAALLHINDIIIDQNEKLKKLAWMQSHELRAPLARFLGIANLLTIDSSLAQNEYTALLKSGIEAAHEVDQVIKTMSKIAWESQLLADHSG
jgi:DNA-binding response OmpR family regulator